MRTFLFLPIMLVTLAFPVTQAVPDDLSPEEVRKAIAGGVRYLKGQQQSNGSFGGFINRGSAGISALCTLALLNAGVPVDDPVMQKALKFLQTDTPANNSGLQTYTTSLQTMVFAQADPKRFRPDILRNVEWLQANQNQGGKYRGAWSYKSNPDSGDNSNSQFALLALHEAERVGVRVSDRTWQLTQEYWQRIQHDDGSFGYKADKEGQAYGSMTCAGIASLVIASGRVREGDAQVRGEQILCCQENESDADRIERALQWLGRNFAVSHNPGYGGTWRYYYLYCLERVGRLTARRFIGDHDWYREGTASSSPARERSATIGKATAIRALPPAWHFSSSPRDADPSCSPNSRHGPEEQWNQHQSDVNNLTRYVESRWGFDLTWQVVDVRAATIDDLGQSPVLYYCGNDNPTPGSEAGIEDLAQKLRGYIDRGASFSPRPIPQVTSSIAASANLSRASSPNPSTACDCSPPSIPFGVPKNRSIPSTHVPSTGSTSDAAPASSIALRQSPGR
jgi:hypothetical protein